MTYELVIIGAGISGLTAARLASERGMEHVLIVDYQDRPGGFTRPYFHAPHFEQEKMVVERAKTLPYRILTQATVVGFFPGENGNHQLFIQTPDDYFSVETRIVVIASGAMEKPREGNRIAGSRPAGVMTPWLAANLLERGYLPGKQVVLYDNGRLTHGLAHLLQQHQIPTQRLSSDITEIVEIKGIPRVTGLNVKIHEKLETVTCDTLIYANGRIPCTFFLKGTPVERDRHHAVIVDERGRTNVPNVYAVGSCTVLGDDNHENAMSLAEVAMDDILTER